jgi:hypothetical protein
MKEEMQEAFQHGFQSYYKYDSTNQWQVLPDKDFYRSLEADGTEPNAFYNNDRFHKAQQTFRLMLEKRAASVLGQMNGSIPSTWEGQKSHPQQLINSDDINLQDLGGI